MCDIVWCGVYMCEIVCCVFYIYVCDIIIRNTERDFKGRFYSRRPRGYVWVVWCGVYMCGWYGVVCICVGGMVWCISVGDIVWCGLAVTHRALTHLTSSQ